MFIRRARSVAAVIIRLVFLHWGSVQLRGYLQLFMGFEMQIGRGGTFEKALRALYAELPHVATRPAQLDFALIKNRPPARSKSQSHFWDAPSTAVVADGNANAV